MKNNLQPTLVMFRLIPDKPIKGMEFFDVQFVTMQPGCFTSWRVIVSSKIVEAIYTVISVEPNIDLAKYYVAVATEFLD